MQKPSLVMVLLLGLLVVFGPACKTKLQELYARQRKEEETRRLLEELCSWILPVGEPPATAGELVPWMLEVKGHRAMPSCFDEEKKALLDRWRNSIVMIVVDGKLEAFGSKGHDGEWHEGRRDDIMVWLREFSGRREDMDIGN
ncbi:MAG: hypothetical protein ACYTF6_00915 [Planctomycetota bacterium]|jgi:hypothetical protein